jgi:predicted DNA-binding transcriptional regulator AlpA
MEQRSLRRIPGVGWEVGSADGGQRMLVRDTGDVFYTQDDLIGTREAASVVGVRPPNFVRDWASRPDFPAPAGVLSSGRVWRASEVREYVRRRRPAKPGADRLAAIARKVAWWDAPERTQSRPGMFIARVLAHGSTQDILDIEAQFGRAAMRAAAHKAPASVLDERARNYWQLVLDLPRGSASPAQSIR